jgi:hypothetical protein
MSNKTCNEIYQDALNRRKKYPLHSGRYKLKEAANTLSRVIATLEWAGKNGNNPNVMCMHYEFKVWTRQVPNLIAEKLGYYVVPAIYALPGDGVSKQFVTELVQGVKPDITACLREGEPYNQIPRRGFASKNTISRLIALTKYTQGIVSYVLDTSAAAQKKESNWCQS